MSLNVRNTSHLTKIILGLLISNTVAVQVSAQAMDMEFRRNNAVVLYEFQNDTGRIVRDTSRIGQPLNLKIMNPSVAEIQQMPDHLWVDTKSLISSETAATKVIDACQASQELTIEAWFENNEGQLRRSGEFPGNTFQPARIVSLSENLLKNNFMFGQFYDMGDFLGAAVNTSGVENPANPGASLANLLQTAPTEVIIPNLERNNPPNQSVQKMILTLTRDAVARLYLTDRDGNIARRQLTSTGFRTANNNIFSDWYPGAKLTLGNLSTNWETVLGDQGDYTKCTDNNITDGCDTNSRYWKGKLYLVAIYCKALTDNELLGEKANQFVLNPVYPIDPNMQVTKSLRKAQDIYRRVSGTNTPIYNPKLVQMAELIDQSDGVAAAEIATRDPGFYNVTLRDMAAQISTRAQNRNVPLNDFTVSFIGAVLDNMDFRKVLYENFVYEANPAMVAVPASEISDILRSATHFESLGESRADLSKPGLLIKKKQRLFNGSTSEFTSEEATAGLLTTRTYLSNHAIAGTNRRPIEKIFEHFLCLPIDKVADSSAPDFVVGKDIDREPGGSYTKYTTTCKACHTILDAMRPAFANYTYNNNFVMHSVVIPAAPAGNTNNEDNGTSFRSSAIAVDAGESPVHFKYNQNDREASGNFVRPGAYVTSNKWINNAVYGANAKRLGWGPNSLEGKGVKSLGKAFSETKQFPICMAKRVYEAVCGREPVEAEDAFIKKAAEDFMREKFSLRYLFQRIVSSKECLGE